MRQVVLSAAKCWLDAALGFFYPEICQYCRQQRATAAAGFICDTCANQAKFIEPPYCGRCGLPFPGDLTNEFECANCRQTTLYFSQARSAVAAEGMVLELIHRYKYHAALWLEPFLGNLLNTRATLELPKGNWDMIIPVPLHRVKEREREFNQAERLARCLSHRTSLPVCTGVLERIATTRTQTRLSRRERSANVETAFELTAARTVAGKRIVLIDDVFTTGATTNACARQLCKGGAREVTVWTLARGIFT